MCISALLGGLPAAARAGSGRAVTVAVLGDSRTDGCVGLDSTEACRRLDIGFNQPVLAGLLALVARQHPAAVFFTGDLTLGLEKEETDGELDPGAAPAAVGWRKRFEYDTRVFSRMLLAFRKTVTSQLGPLPFHPLVGNHDTVGPDAIAIFRRTFDLVNPPGGYREPSHLAYTVTVGDAVFVALATDYYQPCAERGAAQKLEPACNLQQHLVSQPQLAWLDEQLAGHAGQTLFVLGHEPAYTIGPTKQTLGLDANRSARDAFWQILKRRGVTAYLASHQHQFDVSQHDGVWQVISGGAGAPLDGAVAPLDGAGHAGRVGVAASPCTGGLAVAPGYADRSFFHYLLLTLPSAGEPSAPVRVEVRDCQDAVRRTFSLAPAPR